MQLRNKAMEVVQHIDRETLKTEDGIKILFEKLDETFKRNDLIDIYGRVTKFLNIQRNKGEKMADFVIRYEKHFEDC